MYHKNLFFQHVFPLPQEHFPNLQHIMFNDKSQEFFMKKETTKKNKYHE